MTDPVRSVAPRDYVWLLNEAKSRVRRSVLWKRFIDGTPLENDIAVWMTDLASEAATDSVKQHAEAVGRFLNDLYATMIDPCAEGTISVEEMCQQLLQQAERDRASLRELHERKTVAAAPVPCAASPADTCNEWRLDERGELDDVVVEDVKTFRMERMSDDHIWGAIYHRDGSRTDFNIFGDRVSWTHELEAIAATGEEGEPHKDCPTCHGTGECANAQFRCHCRWHHVGCALVAGTGDCDCRGATGAGARDAPPPSALVEALCGPAPTVDQPTDQDVDAPVAVSLDPHRLLREKFCEQHLKEIHTQSWHYNYEEGTLPQHLSADGIGGCAICKGEQLEMEVGRLRVELARLRDEVVTWIARFNKLPEIVARAEERARLRTELAPPARATYVGERPGRCEVCDRERDRTTIVDGQRICDDCFYRLRDVPKP